MSNSKRLSFLDSLIILISILTIIFISLFYLKVEPHLPLFLAVITAALYGRFKGFKWGDLENGIVTGIQKGVQPIIILALIGMLIAAWMYSGTIPTVIAASLKLIKPEYLLITALFSCTIISTLVGSSFTTISTIGVALMGVAIAANVPLTWAAGAIICGACFGDKMSPMSDTTNFASGVVRVNIFSHIKHMTGTTVPSFLITAGIFWYLGSSLQISETSAKNITEITNVIESELTISGWTFLSPILVIAMAIMRIPVIPALVTGILTAYVTTAILQDGAQISSFLTILQSGTSFDLANEQAASMLNRGGLQSMMWSISLIMIAFALGGLLDKLGVIQRLLEGFINGIRSKGQLVLTTALSSIGVNLLTGEQYLSILIPGQSLKEAYEIFQVKLEDLSRTLEDAGTLINPLIPWGVSGAFFAKTLGVDVIEYLPFAFFLYLSPLFTILLGFLVRKKSLDENSTLSY
ncbi:Na+/H+ antiporter NhaC [Metabacillus arenae]|uniref:Na+/H+ antiporter NhaC n=1 Tax=Metabacillus arenae TaxID=2771434 RepID=A0A926NT04_9BACI|nr:Na+/H+ antiporter NhaC [Metabacillus arenae]MBD1383397.1 Na+/H+ antiporter NhaC [Metabacillus arenae]